MNKIQKVVFSLDWQIEQRNHALQKTENIYKRLQDIHYLLETEPLTVEDLAESLDNVENATLEVIAMLERLNLTETKEMLTKIKTYE